MRVDLDAARAAVCNALLGMGGLGKSPSAGTGTPNPGPRARPHAPGPASALSPQDDCKYPPSADKPTPSPGGGRGGARRQASHLDQGSGALVLDGVPPMLFSPGGSGAPSRGLPMQPWALANPGGPASQQPGARRALGPAMFAASMDNLPLLGGGAGGMDDRLNSLQARLLQQAAHAGLHPLQNQQIQAQQQAHHHLQLQAHHQQQQQQQAQLAAWQRIAAAGVGQSATQVRQPASLSSLDAASPLLPAAMQPMQAPMLHPQQLHPQHIHQLQLQGMLQGARAPPTRAQSFGSAHAEASAVAAAAGGGGGDGGIMCAFRSAALSQALQARGSGSLDVVAQAQVRQHAGQGSGCMWACPGLQWAARVWGWACCCVGLGLHVRMAGRVLSSKRSPKGRASRPTPAPPARCATPSPFPQAELASLLSAGSILAHLSQGMIGDLDAAQRLRAEIGGACTHARTHACTSHGGMAHARGLHAGGHAAP